MFVIGQYPLLIDDRSEEQPAPRLLRRKVFEGIWNTVDMPTVLAQLHDLIDIFSWYS